MIFPPFLQFIKVKTFKFLNIFSVAFLSLTFIVSGEAQKSPDKKLAKAKVLYEEEHLPDDALAIYEEVRKNASMSKMMSSDDLGRMGKIYKEQGIAEKAEPLFLEAFEKSPEEYTFLFEYATCVLSNGRYTEAQKLFEQYAAARTQDPRGPEMVKYCDSVKKLKPYFRNTDVEPVNINMPDAEDFAPSILNEQELVFTSDRLSNNKPKDEYSEHTYMDLYVAKRKENGQLGTPVHYDKNINTNVRHESSISFTADGKWAFFVRNELPGDVDNISNFAIYRAQNVSGKWANIDKMSFCNEKFTYLHPYISPDGTRLYFASDKSGGYGKLDLWMAEYKYGKWSPPVNLGPKINTSGTEAFPTACADGRLYFASKDGEHLGFGGYDIFVATPNPQATDWISVNNAGKPINSEKDDMGLVMDAENKEGYFSTNRDLQKGGKTRNRDLYWVKNASIVWDVRVLGEDKTPTSDAFIALTCPGEDAQRGKSTSKGYQFQLARNKKYYLRIERPGHKVILDSLSTANIYNSKTITKEYLPEPITRPSEEGTQNSVPEKNEPIAPAKSNTDASQEPEKPAKKVSAVSVFVADIIVQDDSNEQRIPSAKISVHKEGESKDKPSTFYTNAQGVVTLRLKPDQKYILTTTRAGFQEAKMLLTTENATEEAMRIRVKLKKQ